jgi:carbamoyl-phosphate synthase small subunit
VTYGNGPHKIIAVDCGIKYNMIRYLASRGATVKVVPWNYDFTNEDYDGLFLGNGPGDPEMVGELVNNVRKAYENNKVC